MDPLPGGDIPQNNGEIGAARQKQIWIVSIGLVEWIKKTIYCGRVTILQQSIWRIFFKH